MDKFYKTNRVTADEHDTGKGLFTYSDFSIRLIAIYLSGKQNWRQIVETWLSAGEEYFTNKEFAQERLMEVLNYLDSHSLAES